MPEDRRAAREDLAALRIDRDAVPLRRGPPWRGWLLTGVLVLSFGAASLAAWRMTLGRIPSVQVAFAQLAFDARAAGLDARRLAPRRGDLAFQHLMAFWEDNF